MIIPVITLGGISWTLSEQYANWYAERHDKKTIFMKTVQKKDVFAFIERNNESEIILLPSIITH